MQAYVSPTIPDSAVKSELEKRKDILVEESWFKDLQKFEEFDPNSVKKNLSGHIKELKEDDNLYRLGENYCITQDRRNQYKYRNAPVAITATWAVPIAIALAGIVSAFVVTPALLLAGLYVSFLSLLLPVLLIERWRNEAKLSEAPAEHTKATTDLDRGMRSRIDRSVREVTELKFDKPTEDRVKIGDGAKLSSRVEETERITTRYHPAVELHMLRPGGAAIGVTGERGTGKSELLRSFCRTSVGRATAKDGGTIGVLVSIPAAFQGAEFLTLVARELAQAVPDYRTADQKGAQRKRRVAFAGLILAVLTFSAAFLFVDGFPSWEITSFEVAIALSISGLIIGAISMATLLYMSLTRVTSEGSRGSGRRAGSERIRRHMGRDAERLMLRLQYAETVTSQSEGSLSWGSIGLKRSGQRSLSSLPLTEGSLISEIKTLADRLEHVGYRIVVGIDEMDKLDPGKATDAFLNSVKQLFSIQSCSFIVSVSSSAWARFIQRGINLRDALDSSLDAIESIDSLDFLETRSLILHRDVKMTDSEILFCYVLSGGLPREAMRFAQSLAMRNRDEEVKDGEIRSHFLDVVAGKVLDIEAARLIDASRTEVSSWGFQDRDVVLRRLDNFNLWWRTSSTLNSVEFAGFSWVNDSRFILASEGNLSWVSDSKREDARNYITRLELVLRFLDVVRHLFCETNAVHIEASRRDHVLEVGNKLTAIRRAIETDVFGADRALREMSDKLDSMLISKDEQKSVR